MSTTKKIVIPGGSGQVGTILARAFVAEGYHVTVLTRRQLAAPWKTVLWDGESMGRWCEELDGADAVINLAGRSVDCRYTARNRRDILESRVLSTRLIGEAIHAARRPPPVWLQASTATIYAHRYDAANDEETGVLGGCEAGAPDTWNFSIEVASAWEKALDEADTPRTRKVKLRSAILMSPDKGGPFDILLGLVRWRLGGRAGNGRQYMSWIHDADFVRAVAWLLEHEEIRGVVNLAAPNPLPNAEFMRALRGAWGIGLGLPAPAWLLEIATFVMRTESELVLKSRRVVPGVLAGSGFEFAFPAWREAALDLCQRWRERRVASTAPASAIPCC